MRKLLISAPWTVFIIIIAVVFASVVGMFGWIFWKFDGVVQSDSETKPGFVNCCYFSAITLTTIGYGDFQPSELGRTIAVIEAVIGFFYMWLASGLFVFKLFIPSPGMIITDKLTIYNTAEKRIKMKVKLRNTGNPMLDVRYRFTFVYHWRKTTNYLLLREWTYPTMKEYWNLVVSLDPQIDWHRKFLGSYLKDKNDYRGARLVVNVTGIDSILGKPRTIEKSYNLKDIVQGHFMIACKQTENNQWSYNWKNLHKIRDYEDLKDSDYDVYFADYPAKSCYSE